MIRIKAIRTKYIVLLIFILFSLNHGFSQKTTHKIKKQQNERVHFYGNIDVYTSLYADSINHYKKNDKIILPNYFLDRDFDLQMNYWGGDHKPISLRYLVLEKVTNWYALSYIACLKNPVLDSIPKTDSPLPFREYSLRNLVYFRIAQLLNNEYYLYFKKERHR